MILTSVDQERVHPHTFTPASHVFPLRARRHRRADPPKPNSSVFSGVCSLPRLPLLSSNHNYRKERPEEVMDGFSNPMFAQGIAVTAGDRPLAMKDAWNQ